MNSRAEDEESRRPAPRALTSYALFALVGALLLAFFFAPFFRVSSVNVDGPTRIQSEVQAAAGVTGDNILTIRAATVLARLWKVPNVVPCGVTLSFPNSVTVCAHARKPVLGLQTRGDLELVDKYGRIISTASSTTLPILRDTTGIPRVVGEWVNPWIVTATRYVMSHMTHADVVGFTLGPRRGITIRSQHGWRAVLGLPENPRRLRLRVYTLKAIISHGFKIGHPLEYADLTRSMPVAQWRGLTSVTGSAG
jgi:hypothetical protein